MKRGSFSILHYIRESRIKKDGTAGIEVKITINGERCFFSTGKNIKVENWNKVKQIAKGKSKESQNINNFLQALRNRLCEKEVELAYLLGILWQCPKYCVNEKIGFR